MEPDSAAVRSAVVPIFGTPFAALQIPEASELNSAAAQILAARAGVDAGTLARASKPLCYISRDDLLEWKDEPIKQIAGAVLRGVWSVVAAVNELTSAQLQSLSLQARGWFTILGRDGCVPVRSYPLTSWCAIYCIEVPDRSADRQDSGVLRLYESRFGTMFSDATNSAMRVPFRTGHYTWRPQPGHVAIFPASVAHEIALIRASGRLVLLTIRTRFVGPGQEGLSRW